MPFSEAVYKERLKQAKEIAASRGLSGIILTRPSSVIYISGFNHSSTPERPLFVVLPCNDEPFLLVPAIELAHAKYKSWFKDIRRWYFDLPSSEKPFKSLAKILKEAGMAGKTIGVEDAKTIAIMEKEMPRTNFENTFDIIHGMRMIKSKAETDMIKARAKYADFAMSVLKDNIREGITELELVGIVMQETMLKMAKEVKVLDEETPVKIRVMAGPRSVFLNSFSTAYKLRRGDIISAVVGTKGNGYECGESIRTFFLGEPTSEHRKIYKITLKGYKLALAKMKPGITCDEVYRTNYDYISQMGYGDYTIGKIGGVRGLEAREGVHLIEDDQTVLKKNMMFLMHSGIRIPEAFGFGAGGLVLVTSKGGKSFTKYPMSIENLIIT